MLFLVPRVLCYDFPASFPTSDQLSLISGALLEDPVIVKAIADVKSKVEPALLNIRPSVYQPATPFSPRYVDNAVANCYWPTTTGSCQKGQGNVKPDIITCPGQNQWGITFDDGPIANFTSQLQALLDQNNVKATFFIMGANMILRPEIVKAQFDAGHQIGLHTWTHHPLTSLTNEQIVAELKYNEALIYRTIGKIPKAFRPPYGDIDDRVRAIVQAMGYDVIIWTDDSFDTHGVPLSAIVAKMSSYFARGTSFISLQHDSPVGPGLSTASLDVMRDFFSRNQVLKPVPVGTCLNAPFYLDGSTASRSSGSRSYAMLFALILALI